MSAIVQPHRRNPRRARVAPKRYTDTENTMKGSGRLGEVNGIDFDQYDRQYDGDWHRENMSYGEKIIEAGDNRRMEILTKKLQVINKMENIPEELRRELKKLAYGDNEFVKDADFIAPEGVVEKVNAIPDVNTSCKEAWLSEDETDEESGYDTDDLCEDD